MDDVENVNAEAADIAPFDPSKKKKKKKVVIQDPADDKLIETTQNLSVTDGLDTAYSGLKKKKKKQLQTDLLDDDKENDTDDFVDNIGEDDQGQGIILQHQLPWEGTERDYEYEELLGRVFIIFFVSIILNLLEIDGEQ